MGTLKKSLATLLIFIVASVGVTAHADWKDFFKKSLDLVSSDSGKSDALTSLLSNEDVVAGLKQALEKGTEYAVQELGKTDGFLGNSAVKIPMPKKLELVEKTLRKLKQDKYADEFVITMNRAAELAVPLTLELLKQGVKEMSFDDAKNILNGSDDAATTYLRKVGGDSMLKNILPIVAQMTARTGVTQQYKQLYENLGFLGSMVDSTDYDIDQYVAGKTVEGLFHMIAQEELKIREDPVARTTDLLKKVFAQ